MNPLQHRLLPPLAGVLIAGAAAPAQDQATTLAAACRQADVVVVATVTRAADPTPDWHRLEWRVDERLAGEVATTFALMEPAGACCGRSLFALTAGQQRLLFLRRTGPLLQPIGGARGVLEATAPRRAHVLALLAATSQAARNALLLAGLDHDDLRIASDAAHELARTTGLELDRDGIRRIREALRLAVERGATTAPSLLEVVVRCPEVELLDETLSLYLRQARQDRAALLRSGLLRVAPGLVTARLPAVLGRDREHELRVAELVRAIPGPHGTTAMRALLARTGCPRVALCLAEGLLMRGVPAAALRREVPGPVLDLAVRRADQVPLRTIRPRQR